MKLFATRSDHTPLNLALQGGGAHGAFTWGALEALLADETLTFDGISGTSAGAMNALCLAQGWMSGGRQGAADALARFWLAVAEQAPFATAPGGNEAPGLAAPMRLMLQMSHYLSPAQFNPFDLNPLRDILAEQIDFAGLRRHAPFQLFIAATQANTGKLRLFRNAELSLDAALASACLPTIHHTVEIDGEPYWDGGYSANPAIFPLVHECAADDILLILLAPLRHAATPVSATDIRHRLQDIAFNSTFLREMRMYAHLRDRLDRRWPLWSRLDRQLRDCRFHAIAAGESLADLPPESRLTVQAGFLQSLRERGRTHGERWLADHRPALGRDASLDLAGLFY